MLRITTLLVILVHSALAATILSFDTQTQVLRLETRVRSPERPDVPQPFETAQWSGIAYLRIAEIDQLFPPNTVVNLFVTVPAVMWGDRSNPNHAGGMACLTGHCVWNTFSSETIDFSQSFVANPARADFLVPIHFWMNVEASATFDDRHGLSNDASAIVRIDFSHTNLVATYRKEVDGDQWISREITKLVSFSAASFDPQLPVPELHSLWLAGSALVLVFAGSRGARFSNGQPNESPPHTSDLAASDTAPASPPPPIPGPTSRVHPPTLEIPIRRRLAPPQRLTRPATAIDRTPKRSDTRSPSTYSPIFASVRKIAPCFQVPVGLASGATNFNRHTHPLLGDLPSPASRLALEAVIS